MTALTIRIAVIDRRRWWHVLGLGRPERIVRFDVVEPPMALFDVPAEALAGVGAALCTRVGEIIDREIGT